MADEKLLLGVIKTEMTAIAENTAMTDAVRSVMTNWISHGGSDSEEKYYHCHDQSRLYQRMTVDNFKAQNRGGEVSRNADHR